MGAADEHRERVHAANPTLRQGTPLRDTGGVAVRKMPMMERAVMRGRVLVHCEPPPLEFTLLRRRLVERLMAGDPNWRDDAVALREALARRARQ